MEELLRILQRYRSAGKRSHWKVWLRSNCSSRSDGGGTISRRVTRAVGTQGTPGLTLRLWFDPCLQDVWPVISHTQTLPSDNTQKLPFSRVIVPEFLWTLCSLYFPSQVFFSIFCVFVDFFPLSPPFALLFFGSLIFLSPWTNAAVFRRILRTTAFPLASSLHLLYFAVCPWLLFSVVEDPSAQGGLSLYSGMSLRRDSWCWPEIGLPSI